MPRIAVYRHLQQHLTQRRPIGKHAVQQGWVPCHRSEQARLTNGWTCAEYCRCRVRIPCYRERERMNNLTGAVVSGRCTTDTSNMRLVRRLGRLRRSDGILRVS